MSTLVIHPTDPSTDFLKQIYQGLDATIINENVSNSALIKALQEHDRIIMLGHGLPLGLLGHNRLFIGPQHVQFLRNKSNNVYIWCYASTFVTNYGLEGFASGMFISEVEEATYHEVIITQEAIDDSNNRFAKILNEHISKPKQEMFGYIQAEYGQLISTNDVAKYNWERLKLN